MSQVQFEQWGSQKNGGVLWIGQAELNTDTQGIQVKGWNHGSGIPQMKRSKLGTQETDTANIVCGKIKDSPTI